MSGEFHEFRTGRDGDVVFLAVDKRFVFRVDWRAAKSLGRSLIKHAMDAEEVAKSDRLIRDGAILQRAGWKGPGISANPDIQNRIAVEAAHDRDLRRYMPGGVRGQSKILPGTIIQFPAKRGPDNGQ